MENILKPCPFCGGEAVITTKGNEVTKKRSATIECSSCHTQRTVGAIRGSLDWCKDECSENWNNRPVEQQLQAKDKEIEELRRYKLIKESLPDFQKKELRDMQKQCDSNVAHCLGLIRENKSLQAKLQQAKEGLELADKRFEEIEENCRTIKWYQEDSDYFKKIEEIRKCTRETLEIINKE